MLKRQPGGMRSRRDQVFFTSEPLSDAIESLVEIPIRLLFVMVRHFIGALDSRRPALPPYVGGRFHGIVARDLHIRRDGIFRASFSS